MCWFAYHYWLLRSRLSVCLLQIYTGHNVQGPGSYGYKNDDFLVWPISRFISDSHGYYTCMHAIYWMVPLRMILSILEWQRIIFNDSKHRAALSRSLSAAAELLVLLIWQLSDSLPYRQENCIGLLIVQKKVTCLRPYINARCDANTMELWCKYADK